MVIYYYVLRIIILSKIILLKFIIHNNSNIIIIPIVLDKSAEDILKMKFKQMSLEIDAFSSIKYVGLQTVKNAMNYEQLRMAIETELNDTTIRSARKPYLVYNILKSLSNQSSSEANNFSNTLFPDQYYTCLVKCLSCGSRCNKNMGHIREGKPHSTNTRFVCLNINSSYFQSRTHLEIILLIIMVVFLFALLIDANISASMKI